MLGNDIVDFSIDEKKYLNQRFIKRVLGEIEIEYLNQSNNPNVFLWSLWAAKEASFKAYQKTALQTIFSPSQFQVDPKTLQAFLDNQLRFDFEQPLPAALKFQDQIIHLLYSWPSPSAVHCVAFIGSTSIAENIQISITDQWDDHLDENQSSQVRAVAKKLLQKNHIAAHIDRPILNMADYNKLGPPVLIGPTNQTLPHEISLSHDSRWLAVALLCR